MDHSGRNDLPEAEGPREVEGTMAVYSARPDQTTGRIAGLSSVGDYALRARSPMRIRDTYFDTADGALRAQHAALRLRNLDGSKLLTLKADSEDEDEDDVTSRLEMESAWSRPALDRALGQLKQYGIRLTASSNEREPIEDLRTAGLVPFQDRETVRIPRDVLDPATGQEPVAELVVDTVRFFPPDGLVRWDEVEVEAKGRGDAAVVHRVMAALREAFPAELRPWPYSKLATGLALHRLADEGRLAALVQEDGTLRLEAHAIIEAVVRQESASSV